jgi:GT2 family glycosyltransferase
MLNEQLTKENLKVSLVITNYNGQSLLRANLPFVINAKKYTPNKIEEIIVVDDASTDKSVNLLKKEFPSIKLVKHKKNKGFAAATNTGVSKARNDLVALLNNDVVPDKDFLVKAIPHFVSENVFAVSFHEKGYGWAIGYYKDGFILHSPGKEDDKTHKTFWVNGGSGIFRKTYWEKLGGMDEALLSPFYWEDIDISYRAAKRGWKLLWEPKSVVKHKHESTIGRIFSTKYINRVRERNQLLFIWKNVTSRRLMLRHLSGLIKRLITHPKYLIIILSAIPRLGIVLQKRAVELKEAILSDEEVITIING